MDNNILKMIQSANEGNPSAFNDAVKDEINARIMDQIEAGRQEYLDTMFGTAEIIDSEEEVEFELEPEEEVEEDENL